jgi:hypothetical protein
MKESKFTHCLRAQIYPDEYAHERIASLKSWCKEYGFSNVILFFNGEEYCVGHITKEQLSPWLEVIKEAKKEFAEEGITTSLNPWFELGHIDRGRSLQEGQSFQTMVDRFGKQAALSVCPLDETWKSYYLDLLSYYVKQTKPEVLWIEDDFRLHNHEPLDWGGCWCPLHMEAFSKRLGKEETREEFVKAIESKEPTEERKVWLDESFACLDDLAKEIKEKVVSLDTGTKIGLMSSTPWMHAMEGRDWHKLHLDLSTEGTLIDRIHLPSYREAGAKQYYFDFNRISMVVRSFIGDDCLIYPELENSSYSDFVKDPKFVSFQVEGALPLGLEGMTYNIFQCAGNGAQEELGYGKAIKAITPYLNRVKALNLLPSQMQGLMFPIDERTVYSRRAENGFLSLIPDDFDCLGFLSSLGYSYHLSKNKAFKGERVVLCGQNVMNFSDDELASLFKDNYVFLDGGAVLALKERGLNERLGIASAENRGKCHIHDCFEMLEQGKALNGIHHYRSSSQRRCGDYVKIEYSGDFDILTGLYDPFMKRTGNGFAIGENFCVYPYILIDPSQTDFFVTLRRHLLEKALLGKTNNPLAYSHNDAVYCYLYKQEGRFVLLLVNANYNDFEEVKLTIENVPFKVIKNIDKNGNISDATYSKEGNEITIHKPLPYLSSISFLLE